MRKKKLLATAVAGTLVAAQMAMPVMAADGGEVEVEVTTKTAVIRVEVPTSMVVSVDQFMMGDGLSQIYSEEFTMENKSAVDVKVTVTSTAKLAATTKLVATKAGAKESTKEGEAWLGMAAQTRASGDKYDDPNTDTTDPDDASSSDTPETIGTLTEANANVATFVQGTDADAAKGKASQVFYLAKGAGNTTYTMLFTTDDPTEKSYAQFYELKAETIADDSDAQATLDALVAEKDVYFAAAAAGSNQSLTLVAKGSSQHTYSNSEVYYTAAETSTAPSAIVAESTRTKLYVYGGTANAAASGGNAAFRYIGALSGGQESWTNDDIKNITIKYDIVGVDVEKYGEVEDDCKYGLYIPADVAPSATAQTATFSKASGAEITVDLGAGSLAATGIASLATVGGDGKDYVWAAADYSFAGSKVTLNKTAQYLAGVQTGGTRKLKITFNDTKKTVVELTVTVAQ